MIITVLLTCDILHVRAATAATYYVATTGNDANPGSQAQPFQTIRKGLSVLKAGDTLYLRGGTYREGINYNSQTIPSGTSWNNAVTIVSYPNETAILQPGGGTVLDLNATNRPMIQYLIFDTLVLDAAGATSGMFVAGAAQYIRLQNSEVKNANATGIQAAYGPTNLEFVKLHVHNNGSSSINGVPMDHGFYVCVPNMVIRDSDIHDNWGYGLQIYATGQGQCNNNVSVYNNRLHNNGSGGATLDYGDNIKFYNNLVYTNTGSGVDVFYSVNNAQVVNNTIYNNRGYGVEVAAGSTGAVIKNNIVYQNGGAIQDGGTGTVVSNNLMLDPKFSDPSTANFQLQSTSPAIDAGVALSAVQTDYTGAPRPQGAGYDIGAHEYQSRQWLPPVTNVRVMRVIP
jgi:hypothetical protein